MIHLNHSSFPLILTLGISLGTLDCKQKPTSSSSPNCQLTVFAASSLRDVVEKLTTQYKQDHPTCQFTTNYAASNKLGQQIEAGAKADVFISASKEPIERVERAGTAIQGSKRALFSNQLVVISHKGEKLGLTTICDLLTKNPRKIAIGQPDAVPAGQYAKNFLSNTHCNGSDSSLWNLLEPKLLPLSEVRAVLAAVEREPGLVGFVYRTDAMSSKEVEQELAIDGPSAPHIEYFGIGITLGGAPLALDFLHFFETTKGHTLLNQYGFVVPQEGPS